MIPLLAVARHGRAAEVSELRLSCERVGAALRLTWPASTLPLTLQSATNLGFANWQTVRTFSGSETNLLLTNAASDASFFRLHGEVLIYPAEREIRALLAKMKSKAEAHDLEGFMALFAADYANSAEGLADLRSGIASAMPGIRTFDFDATNIVIAAEAGTARVYGSVTITFDGGQPTMVFHEPSADDEAPGFGCLKRVGSTWLIHGNQQRASVGVSTAFDGVSRSFRVSARSPSPLASGTVSGPNIPPTAMQPDSEWGGLTVWVTPNARPPVGTSYRFDLKYGDGSQETLYASVHSYLEVTPAPVTLRTAPGSATISWKQVLPMVPGGSGYWVWVYDAFGHMWRSNDDSYLTDNSITVTSALLGFPLQSGRGYSVNIYLFNGFDDFAEASTSFTMP